jgi:hypothetical protein
MYSNMMTPVCTHTPNSARNPTPDDTLMWVYGHAFSWEEVTCRRRQTASIGGRLDPH